MRRSCAAAIAAVVVVSPTSALAQSTAPGASVAQSLPANVRSDLARTHFRTGMQYYDLGRFAEAAVEFERVHEFTGQHELLYNIARAHEAAGNLRRAVETYDQFLALVPTGPSVVTIRAHADELRPRAQAEDARRARTPEGLPRCAPDEGATSTSNTASVATVTSATTNTSATDTAAQRASSAPPLLQLRTRVQFERGAFDEVGPWILVGAGAIVGGFAAWQSVVAVGQRATVERANTGLEPWTIAVDAAYRGSTTASALAWGLGAGGVALLGSGVVWAAARGRGARREIVVAAAPNGAGATVLIGGAL